MKPKAGSLIILILCSFFSADVMARFWSFELGALGQQTKYTETRPTQNFLDSDFRQESIGVRGEFKWNFVPKWFSFNLDVDYSEPLTSNSDNKFSMLNQRAQLAWTLPARPLNLSLVAEQFYNLLRTNNDSFGYDFFNTVQLYPQIDYTSPGGFFTIYGRIPLVTFLEVEKKEFTYGVIFRFAENGAKWPEYYFLKGWNLRAEFREIELEFTGLARPVTVKTQTLGISLNYSY